MSILLNTMAKEDDWRVTNEAIQRLPEICPPNNKEAVRALIDATKDDAPHNRCAAIRSIDKIVSTGRENDEIWPFALLDSLCYDESSIVRSRNSSTTSKSGAPKSLSTSASDNAFGKGLPKRGLSTSSVGSRLRLPSRNRKWKKPRAQDRKRALDRGDWPCCKRAPR